MACGSVAQTESAISLANLNLTRCDLSSSPTAAENPESSVNRSKKYRGESSQDAVLFLQREHEQLLSGLHVQVELLQQKCDDLQFEVHLRHLNTGGEDTLKKKVEDLTSIVKGKNQQLSVYKRKLEEQDKSLVEEREHHRWKELKLKQQVEVGDQRTLELKAEISRLKGQVHDLKVFSSALRTSTSPISYTPERQLSTSKTSLSSSKTSHSLQRASQESLESLGPRSLGSEEGDLGMWKEARVASGLGKFTPLKGARPVSSQSQSFQPRSLPPISHSATGSRPSSSMSSVSALPPIAKSQGPQGVNRPHVRRQLRLLSAPNLDFPPKTPRKPP